MLQLNAPGSVECARLVLEIRGLSLRQLRTVLQALDFLTATGQGSGEFISRMNLIQQGQFRRGKNASIGDSKPSRSVPLISPGLYWASFGIRLENSIKPV